jgi:predicted TIM-barrel fold metal-dependent hydrolase
MTVVDFCVRPPYRGFRDLPLYHSREEDALPPHAQSGLSSGRGPTASHRERSMDLFMQEMNDAGIDIGVVLGRQTPARGFVDNDDVAALVDEYPGRFIGFGGIDLSAVDEGIAEVERCVQLGLRGVSIDPPWGEPARDYDDPALDAFYHTCETQSLIVVMTASIYVGADLSVSDPIHLQRVAERHPSLPIAVSHVCWPHVNSFLGVAFRYTNIYALPDRYLNTPGLVGVRELVDAANGFLKYRMLFGSAYPARSLGESIEAFRSLDLSHSASEHALGRNATRLLDIS